MAGQVIRYLAEWLIIAFILFALLFETILHKLEHWVHAHHAHVQAVLRNLYREIMILGVISFSFIMYIFIADPSSDLKFTFEVAHVWVFLFACFHTFIVSTAVFISLRLSKRWKSLERMDLVKYLEYKASYLKLTEKRTSKNNFFWRNIGWWISNPGYLFRYRKLHEIMTFHDIRYQFIYYRNLRPDFRFSKFLRKIKFATLIEMVEIHPVNWIILLVLILFDILRIRIGSHVNFEPFFLIAHSVFNILLVSVLARKIRNIYWKVTKNPATYFDSIDPHAFRAELRIAEEEARIRNKPPRTSIQKSTPAGSRAPSKDHGHGKFVPVHQHMAFVPGHGEGSSDVRYSLDVEKARKGQNSVSTDYVAAERTMADQLTHIGPTALNLLDKARAVHERKPFHERMSLDMALAIPEKELGKRAQPTHEPFDYSEEDIAMLQHMSSQRRKLRVEALRRLRERKTRNAAIVETAQDLEAAQASSPRRNYPRWVVKLFPRLGRVASATEKLFWFGSHRFYLFCVEFVIFFSNVNLSTSISKLAFLLKETADYNKYKKAKVASTNVAKAAKFVIVESVRAAAKGAKKAPVKPKDSLVLIIIALVIGVVALAVVLFRVASIFKKYIFILNNANLLPEDMMIETIQHINLNDIMNAETMDTSEDMRDYDSDSDTEAEDLEGTNYRSMRRNMSTFLEKEQQGNNNNSNITPLSPLLSNDDFVVNI